MVFNATFNTISVISWRSVLIVKETSVLEDFHRPVVSHWQTLSHIVVKTYQRQQQKNTEAKAFNLRYIDDALTNFSNWIPVIYALKDLR